MKLGLKRESTKRLKDNQLDNIKEYTPKDYYEISSWFWGRDMAVPLPEDLPEVGLIVPGVAAGFLIWTDTSVAILDFFITNPKEISFKRGRALNDIIDGLMLRAKQIGFTKVKCDSNIAAIQRKAKSLGFSDLGTYKAYSREI